MPALLPGLHRHWLPKVVFGGVIALCLAGILHSSLALLAGFVFSLIFGTPLSALSKAGIHYLLKTAIVGLGFGMVMQETLQVSADGFVITVITLVTTLMLGWIFGAMLGIDQKLRHLIASGTAICGGSAIAAIAAVIKANSREISVSLAIVFLLNALALFIFPPIAEWLGLSQVEFGLWAAIAIHDTSSVVGAALTYGEESLRVATTVKLARTLWIIPLSLASMLLFKSGDGKVKIPWFIFMFIGAMLINSYLLIPIEVTDTITLIARRLMVATLFLVGSMLSIEQIRQTGFRPFLLGTGLWLFISVLSLVIILS